MNQTQEHELFPRLRFPDFQDEGGWHSGQLNDALLSISNGLVLEQGSDVTGYKVTRIETIATGAIDPHRIGLVKTSQDISSYKLRVGDILLSNINSVAHIGKSAFVDHDYDLHHGMNLLRLVVNKSKHYPKFIFYLINTDEIRASLRERANKAVNQASINQTELGKTEVALPLAPEQQKIADCLSSLDNLIRLEAEKLDAIKAHKNGLMQQLFPAEGETLPKLRFPEFREAGEWTQMPLSKVCDVLQGYGFPVKLQGKNVGKYPFCKVSDISRGVAESGGVLTEAANYVDDEDLRKLRAKPIPKGATVFAKIGEALRLNRRAFVQRDCLIDNNATGLKAIDGAATDYFVYLLSQRIDLNKHCGGAVPSVNKSTLEEIEVIVPDPDEQKRIADCLSSLDDALAVQFRKVETFKIHKKGLMQQLFPVLDEVQE